MYYRKANKYAKDISIDEPIGNDEEGKELTLGDIIEHSESDFVEKIVHKESFIQLVNIILNYLEEKARLAILYRMGEVSQADIAEKLNISQSYVSRIVTKATNKIRKVVNHQVHYKEVFSMTIVGEEYRISFSSKDISKFNKIFATLLQNLTSTEKLPDFRVNCNKERIVVQVPTHPESFSFIAQIIQEIDDFSMSFVSDKRELPAENNATNKVVSNDIDERDVTKSTAKRVNHVKLIRDYMLSMSSFTLKDLRCHFPNHTTITINNAVYLAKNKGLITATGRGEYVVNKN